MYVYTCMKGQHKVKHKVKTKVTFVNTNINQLYLVYLVPLIFSRHTCLCTGVVYIYSYDPYVCTAYVKKALTD